jgi:exodeoxyribonuclease VII large subunit
MEPEKRILTVTELTQQIKTLLESHFPFLWVEGEISNVRRPSSGHTYFTLKDEYSQIRAVLFRSQSRYVGFDLEDGLQAICRGQLTVYEPRGDYQLILDYVEPKGIGALQKAFEQLKEKLLKEGLFDAVHKKPLPMLPRKIGVITSPTGAAIRDILEIVHRRFENVEILVYPVRVQGELASGEVTQALLDLNKRSDLDVIIVARGGGSLEDLWPFNHENVARAVRASAIPVISAVGHEIDFTICDFAADVRAPTPSAAAEMVVREKKELVGYLEGSTVRMNNGLRQRLSNWYGVASSLGRRIRDPHRKIRDLRLRLDDVCERLQGSTERGLLLQRRRLTHENDLLLKTSPKQMIGELVLLHSQAVAQLKRSTRQALKTSHQTVERYVGQLEALSPLAILKRGYSITRTLPSLSVVTEARSVAKGQRVNVKLFRGDITCVVEEKTES